jgi:hypothetical protein
VAEFVVEPGSVRIYQAEYRAWEEGDLRRELVKRAVPVQAAVTRGCPKHTATLASTIRKNDGRDARGIYVDIVVGREGITPYLGYILNGTPPHIIARRNAKALRFIQNGTVVFRVLVRHPGTQPNNFMERGLREGFRV